MTYRLAHWSQGLHVALLSVIMCFTSGCSAKSDNVQASFLWGPVESDLSGPSEAANSSATRYVPQTTHAERLREELLDPVTRYAPDDRDWRVARGTDKGPTIFGARLSVGFGEQGHTQLRFGAVKRGANRTYGPQLIFNFKDD